MIQSQMPSILFASRHCYLDFASGAAGAARDLFLMLAERGWTCRVVCGSDLDTPIPGIVPLLDSYRPHVQTHTGATNSVKYSIHQLSDAGIDVRVYQPSKWSNPVDIEEGYPFLQILDDELRNRRPDLLLTFGGGWLGRGLMAVARRHGVPVVFWLRNMEYKSADLFASVAGIIVPSRFAADHYKSTLKLDCEPIASPVRLQRVLCPDRQPKFVTFISPCPNKGVFFFARIASELGRLRPDIPMLVVLGRGDNFWLDRTGLDLRGLPNMKIIPAVSDPREFYRVTRAILAPSLWRETFLRVAAEGMFNGIPTLASSRGAVPDTLGDTGFLFDIAPFHTPQLRRVPNVREVAPWIDTLQRLFDDSQFESQQHEKCMLQAERYTPERVFPPHEQCLLRAIKSAVAHASTTPLAADLAFLQRFFREPVNLDHF
jgi:glycosyltransferase involved in cell wall biosynthesis